MDYLLEKVFRETQEFWSSSDEIGLAVYLFFCKMIFLVYNTSAITANVLSEFVRPAMTPSLASFEARFSA